MDSHEERGMEVKVSSSEGSQDEDCSTPRVACGSESSSALKMSIAYLLRTEPSCADGHCERKCRLVRADSPLPFEALTRCNKRSRESSRPQEGVAPRVGASTVDVKTGASLGGESQGDFCKQYCSRGVPIEEDLIFLESAEEVAKRGTHCSRSAACGIDAPAYKKSVVLCGDPGRSCCRQCIVCGSAFGEKAQLLYHMMRTHGFRDAFACEMPACERAFLRKSELSKHAAWVHIRQTRHQCPKCSRPFFSKADMQRHLAALHCHQEPEP